MRKWLTVSSLLNFAWVVDDKMYCGNARLCVCLYAAACPHYCTDPDVTWGSGRGCPGPLVVNYWADLQSVHGLRCYGNITRTLVTSLRPSRYMTTECERSAWSARAARWWLGGGVLKIGRRIWEVGVADWPSTGGVLNITAAAWTAGFHWWHSGNITRTQNVALCLVIILTLVRT